MFEIIFWHSFNQNIFDELMDTFGNSIHVKEDELGKRIFLDASIETFYKKYPRSFKVIKSQSTFDMIGITHHNSFEQR